MNFIEIENRHTSGLYAKRKVCFVRGQGIRLWDAEGKEYLDFGAGISVANLGHCHPRIVAAIEGQARRLITASELAYNDQRAMLLQRLAEVAPPGIRRFFFCNSGAEAIEGCIKFAVLSTGRSHFVATMRGFHGRTLGALAATYEEKYRAPFARLCPSFSHVPYNKPDKLAAVVTEETAGVILELVQGEGGIRPAETEFVLAARDVCQQVGAHLIVDEVQTGFGRTGAMFACEHFGLQPDLLALGKALAGGVPMGAIGIGNGVKNLEPGLHGCTFGGNPLSCATALAHLEVLREERLVERARDLGRYFLEKLSAIDSPLIREVRGCGLMLAVEMKHKVAQLLDTLLHRGFLVLNAGPTVLRFLPPLIVEQAQIDALVQTLTEIMTEHSTLDTESTI